MADINVAPSDGRNKADTDLENALPGSVTIPLLAAEVIAWLTGLASGDSFRVPNVADLPATVNGTAATRFAEVYADSVSPNNNGRYYNPVGSSAWTKVPGDVTGRVASLEVFQQGAEPRLPVTESQLGMLEVLLDANRRPVRTHWTDGTTSLRLAADSIPTISYSNLDSGVKSSLPITDDYNGILWILRDPNGRPLMHFPANGRAVLRLEDGTVTGAMIASGTLGTAHLGDGVVTRAKMAAEAQLAFPTLDDFNGILWILRDSNGRPLMYFDPDGTLRAKIAGTEDTALLREEMKTLHGWCWGEQNLANTHLRLSRIKAGYTERFAWCAMGDSWTDHPQRYLTPALRLLQAEYGGTAAGYFGLGYFLTNGGVSGCVDRSRITGSADTAWTRDYSTPGGVYAPNAAGLSSATPGTWVEVNVAVAQPSPKLSFRRRPGGGSFRWRVDAGAWTTVSTDGSDGYASVTLTIPSAACVIRIEVETAGTNGVTLDGLLFESTTGAVIHKWARAQSQAGEFVSLLNKAYFQASVTAAAPHLISFLWATNEQGDDTDPAVLSASILALIDWIREVRPLCDFLIICPAQTSLEAAAQYGIRDYRDAARAAAITARAGFIDLTEVWGEYDKYKYSADSSTLNFLDSSEIHPDLDRGAIVTADSVFKFLTKRV